MNIIVKLYKQVTCCSVSVTDRTTIAVIFPLYHTTLRWCKEDFTALHRYVNIHCNKHCTKQVWQIVYSACTYIYSNVYVKFLVNIQMFLFAVHSSRLDLGLFSLMTRDVLQLFFLVVNSIYLCQKQMNVFSSSDSGLESSFKR